ncbi:hypothetical protein EDD75_2228 [Thermodesulfitimonas autotrophica]|uniref:NPCBM/NEW2 domain-containing protein n=1 Tax=Thermodesulfitimonas autotrophica TaxID=1894989 RepID=A0A3N5ABL3_9THEO|nr:hypothetical protein [Thermodesulfitimonas autotrophica]RPF42007.1 hypothetical protein EDD75_2228 [Thermodesulfitimonas autotrophica]
MDAKKAMVAALAVLLGAVLLIVGAGGGVSSRRPARGPVPLPAGPVAVREITPTDPDISGALYRSVVEIRPRGDWNETRAATVTWVLSKRYSAAAFTLTQPVPRKNLESYAPTLVEVYLDGKKAWSRRVSKDALLTSPARVALRVAGAECLTLRVAAEGGDPWVTKSPYTVWLAGFELKNKQGG